MTFVEKREEPPSLAVHRETGNVGWNVPGDVKEDIRRGCRIEQGDLCAFCCAKLPADPELQRIAHVVPRDVDANLTLVYSNMVLSCSSGRYRSTDAVVGRLAQSCDEAQGPNRLPVSPLQPDCQERFTYDRTGRIYPTDEGNGAREAITLLNLDCDRLRQSRMRAIRAAQTMRDRIEPEQWDRVYRDPLPQYRREFWPAITSAA